jgi:hypothetical protein
MTIASQVNTALGRMLWPERVPITDQERRLAEDRLAQARSQGERADDRRGRLSAARTRADLRAALTGLPGVRPHAGLAMATRVVTVLWLGASAVQFVVWVLIVLVAGHWGGPWWLWTAIPGGALAAGLWWLAELEHQSLTNDSRMGSETDE